VILKQTSRYIFSLVFCLSFSMILIVSVKSQMPPAGYLADFSENISAFHDSNSFIININQDSLRWDLLKIQAPDA
jgi:hypothetical protein